ncbi:MAG TPA: hypothetical protein DCW83_11015 [Saprospirales bacterium]|jgi:hypothetical protein|nr:hypothetical protein [Saprospirales bacterium]
MEINELWRIYGPENENGNRRTWRDSRVTAINGNELTVTVEWDTAGVEFEGPNKIIADYTAEAMEMLENVDGEHPYWVPGDPE